MISSYSLMAQIHNLITATSCLVSPMADISTLEFSSESLVETKTRPVNYQANGEGCEHVW